MPTSYVLSEEEVQPAMARRSPIRMNIAGRREPVSRDSKDEVPSVQRADLQMYPSPYSFQKNTYRNDEYDRQL
jgi:hypothetical protein